MRTRLFAVALAVLAAVNTFAQGAPSCNTKRAFESGSYTVDLNGAPIRYEIRGSGPVLMVLPNSWGCPWKATAAS